MKAEALERLARCLEAFNQRLTVIETRFVKVEGHLADCAQATEEATQHLATIAASTVKLQELYVALDAKMDQHIDIMQNFIDETKRLRVSSQQLISEVRRKEASG